MNDSEYLIEAAGGNITAIKVIDKSHSSEWYAEYGSRLSTKFNNYDVEQSGFFINSEKHFQMAGGEFCGNATRAAAIALFNQTDTSDLHYTVSGFNGTVHSIVNKIDSKEYLVESTFPNMRAAVTESAFCGKTINVVDLGGIVHVVINDTLPDNYEEVHKRIVNLLHLENRSAVGVIWYKKTESSVDIHPVVWVNSINSFFYETSCGSGSIAVAIVTGIEDVRQVTNEIIHVKISESSISLKSQMKVLYQSSAWRSNYEQYSQQDNLKI